MIDLPDKAKVPHEEVEEGGKKTYWHPGYMVKRCETCNREFVCSVQSLVTFCGYKDCGKEGENDEKRSIVPSM